MTHPLDQVIAKIRASARRLGLVYGSAWTLAALLASVVCLGLLDYYLRTDVVLVRLLLSLGVVLAVAAAAWRLLMPALSRPLGDVALAQRVQARFPSLEDRVASGIEFLRQKNNEPTAGSPLLRQAVIVDATTQLQSLNVGEVFDRRPVWRAVTAALCASAVALTIGLVSPASAKMAVRRLAIPWGAAQWPRYNELAFSKAPHSLAVGQLFEVELYDRNGRLPDNVQIQYRFTGADGASVQTEPMRLAGNMMVAHRESVRRPFSYRAFGGDDDSMPWHELSVVEPPRVESLGVTMTPPGYTGWPVETSTGRVAALAGTRLQFKVAVSKPLKVAALVLDGGTRVPAQLGPDGRSFVIPPPDAKPLLVKESGNYWFELTDLEGITSGSDDRWPIHAVRDEPPTVTLEKPSSDLYLTAAADVPIRVLAKDLLAIKQIALLVSRSDRSMDPNREIVLYAGPEKVPPVDRPGMATATDAGERRIATHTLKLGELNLAPGTQLMLHATATDYRPATNQSTPVRITIITPRQLDERLARQEALVLSELAQVVPMQKEARRRNMELQIQQREVGHLSKRDLDQLQGLELVQRDVRRKLSGGVDSIRTQIDALLEQLSANKVKNPEIERRMQGLAALIDQLEKGELPSIESDLTSALKNSQSDLQNAPPGEKKQPDKPRPNKLPVDRPPGEKQPSDKKPSETGRALDSAGQQQDRVVQALDDSLQQLERWSNYRRFAGELSGIEERLRQNRKRLAELMPRTLGRDPKDLLPQEVADLKKEAEKQLELAREFDRAVEGMEKARQQLEQTDPLVAQSLDDAIAHARSSEISRQMRAAGSQAQRNQVSEAMGQQQEADQNLQEMLDILSNRREQELSRLVKRLQETQSQLKSLSERQSALRKRLQEAAKIADPAERQRELQRLSREQKQLEQEAGRLVRQLKRLDAQRAAAALARAGSKMGSSAEAQQGGDAQRADDKAAEAQRDLEDAARELARDTHAAQSELAQEELERLEDQLVSVRERQLALTAETRRLEGLRVRQQRLTRGQEASVGDLSQNEKALAEETRLMAQKLTGADGFHLALLRAALEMVSASDQLATLDTGSVSQKFQQRAVDRLSQILAALKADKPDKEDEANNDQGPGPSQGPQKAAQGGSLHTLSELKLLRLMQEEIRTRTAALDERKRTAAGLTEAELHELADLAEEQGVLSGLMLKLRGPAEAAPEEDPDRLPGGEESTKPKAPPGAGKQPTPPPAERAS